MTQSDIAINQLFARAVNAPFAIPIRTAAGIVNSDAPVLIASIKDHARVFASTLLNPSFTFEKATRLLKVDSVSVLAGKRQTFKSTKHDFTRPITESNAQVNAGITCLLKTSVK